ncbi:hypothetical protein BDQ17DRAFT_1263559, partial [Cyathus striatus]
LEMESANVSKSKTLGLLSNLKVSIGSSNFYVQAQVVLEVLYDMLLGLPFFTLTQASIHHFNNSNAHLVLQDPNTHEVITVPTITRCRKHRTDINIVETTPEEDFQ